MNRKQYFERLKSLSGEAEFESLALKVFRFQSEHCAIYSAFLKGIGSVPGSVEAVKQIPFLPVEFFKSAKVITGSADHEFVFESSGTTGEHTARHYVKSLSFYENVFLEAFRIFYGDPSKYVFLALLPSYLGRNNSSLIYMADRIIKKSSGGVSGFYLDDHLKLLNTLESMKREKRKTILLGVTYALLDFAEKYSIGFPELIVMETGGMKGRRDELVRNEVHEMLCRSFGTNHIHSEYGMTELLSQAYSKGDGIFNSPPWMKVVIRDPLDPFNIAEAGMTGGVNIIDLANIDSCAFIATQDLGKLYIDNSFKVLGRFDYSDLRGCNLLV